MGVILLFFNNLCCWSYVS